MLDSSALWKNREAYNKFQQWYDEELAKITVPYEAQYVETRHGTTHVVTAGHSANPPLIFWHGMNVNMTMWIREINAFAADYYVIAPDCVGDMGRSAPNRLNRRTHQHGEWAADVLSALNIQQAHHVGISGGGWMILKLATVATDTILSATLASTGGFINVDWRLALKFLPMMLFTPPDKLAYKFAKVMGLPGQEPGAQELQSFEFLFNFKTETGVPGPTR